MLVERFVSRVFDRNGRCWQRVTFHRLVAPAEYDANRAARAASGRPKCLRQAIGDERKGAELLAEAEADLLPTLASLLGTDEGRTTLDRLAEEVKLRFARRVAVARACAERCPNMAQWLRALVEDYRLSPPPPLSEA
jgi:hypothetical protein